MHHKDFLERIAEAGLKPPEELTLMITGGCNLHCRHCLLDCPPLGEKQPVPRKFSVRLIEEFAILGGTHLTLTGGETLTHPDWIEILHTALFHFGYQKVCLQTNATLINSAIVSFLTSLPADRFVLQVSLDGATAKTHDIVRGNGSFESTLEGLRLLSRGGLARQTRLAFTEMRHNFHEIPQLLELVNSLGISSMVSNTLVKGGRATHAQQLTLPLPEQYVELIDLYRNNRQLKEHYVKYANIAAIEWYKGQRTSASDNCTCIENLFIDADGSIYPCVMLLYEDYAIENAHFYPLETLLSGALSLWAKLPAINHRRQAEIEGCISCPGHRHCAGGCMGRAYSAYGEFMREEDRCSLRKAVYGLKK